MCRQLVVAQLQYVYFEIAAAMRRAHNPTIVLLATECI
jgi:hypothetical protein